MINMVKEKIVKKPDGEEITLLAEFYKNSLCREGIQVVYGNELLYEYDIRTGDSNATHYMSYDFLNLVYPEQHWDTREKYQENWKKQGDLFDSIVEWVKSIAKEFLSKERNIFVGDIMELEKEYPQVSEIPSGSVLLGYSMIAGNIVRAYNYWDKDKKYKIDFQDRDIDNPQ